MALRKAKFESEAQLAAAVVSHLREHGWEVWQEVRAGRISDRRADIVATMGRRVMVVETKLSLSAAVVGQAFQWRPYAHWVVVAVPFASRDAGGVGVVAILRRPWDRRLDVGA